MTTKFKIWIPAYLIFLLSTVPGWGQLYTLQTKHLRLIYYNKANEYVVPHAARCFENAFGFNQTLYSYHSSEKVTVFLQDLHDYLNAGAGTVPNNLLSLSIAPNSYVFETSPANERINSTLNHEMVHIVTMDKASHSDRLFRHLFNGKVAPIADNPLSLFYNYLTNPYRSSPRWYREGIAVFLETWMAGGLGRALGAYDEMMFRTMVRDSSTFYDMTGLESEGIATDFQAGATAYLYGTRFMNYLAYRHGPEKLIQWTSRSNESDRYFASQFHRVYGVSLDKEWSQWIEWEHQWQKANLDSIRVNPVTPYRPVAKKALGSASRGYYDPLTKKLYVAIRYPGQVAAMVAIHIDSGEMEKICDIKGAALYYVSSVTFDPAGGMLYFTSDNNDWRDLNVVDLKTGKSRKILNDIRVGDLTFNKSDKSIWGVRHDNGISTIVRIPYPYTEWNQVYSWPYGKDVFDIDISNDGSILIAGLAEVSGQQKLIKMEIAKLLRGDTSYEVLFDFEISTPANFTFSANDRYLFGSSYFTGVSNIYRYELQTKDMSIMSNCETGFFRPIPVSDDSLIVFRHGAKGFLPVKIAIQNQKKVGAIQYLGEAVVDNYPVVKSWKLDPPSKINLDSLTIYTGNYHPLQNIRIASAYPVVEGYKNFPAYGMRFNFSDPTLLHNLDLTLSYTPNQNLPANERLHAVFNHRFWGWKISATYNGASFYDLFGPVKVSRKGYSMGVQYKKYLIYDEPRTLDYTLKVTGYGGLEKLPDYQNIATSFDKFLSTTAGINYKFLHSSLGSVDYEKGYQWQTFYTGNLVKNKFFPRFYTNFDYGIPLPLDHSSIWTRNSFGFSSGDRTDPFANFYFGGFGNNWVDYQNEKKYREYYSFPGVPLNEIGGTNYGKTLVEWALPPLRFRRLGIPGFYSSWARVALFTSGIVTNIGRTSDEKKLANIGSQIDFRIIMLYNLNFTLSLGYAVAVEKDQRQSHEFMFSLKLL